MHPMPMRLIQKTGLALLAAAAIAGVAQTVALPSRAGAQTPPVAPDAATGVAVAPVPPAPRTLSATGIGQTTADAGDPGMGVVSMNIEVRAIGGDVQGAVKTAQERQAKLTAALTKAGVPAGAIHVQGFNVSPGYPVPMPAIDPAVTQSGGGVAPAVPVPAVEPTPAVETASPAGGAAGAAMIAPRPTGTVVNVSIAVDTTGPDQTATVMRIAIENGVTNVHSYVKGGPGIATPADPARLAAAVQRATEQARAMAKASADAAGLTLGAVQSVTVLPPTPSYNGGPVTSVTWQVQVRLTYALQ